MSVIASLDRLRQSSFNIDGERDDVVFAPRMSEEEISSFEQRIGSPLPVDFIELLRECRSIGGVADLYFDGTLEQLTCETYLINNVPIGHDGFGNYWLIDLLPERETLSTVYYVARDPAVTLFQAHGIANFIDQLVEFYEKELPPKKGKCLFNRIHDDEAFNVYRKEPNLISRDEGLLNPDPAIRGFSEILKPGYRIIDLRSASPGMGFRTDRYGPSRTEVVRFGQERIFAYGQLPKEPGILSRLVAALRR